MFEDAMMESSGRINTRSKYYTFFGALLNGSLLAGLILFPLLHPEALPKNAMSAMLVAPAPPPPPPPLAPQQTHPVHMVPEVSEFNAPSRIPKQIAMGADTARAPSPDPGIQNMGEPAGPPNTLLDGIGSGSAVAVVKAPPLSKIAVSRGVMAGNIVSKPDPTYPAIAKAARIQGTVILSATISKTGTIENLTVVSGPQMLAQAALDAVRNWRYRPYLLNGEPVEVQTTVNVTFTLGGS
jgi:protein TonB